MKAYTDIEQSKELAKILPLESADMIWVLANPDLPIIRAIAYEDSDKDNKYYEILPAWSLAALLKCIGKIKPQVYTPVLFLRKGKWILQFVEYGHGNVCEVSCNNPVDTCYEMILKLHEQNLL